MSYTGVTINGTDTLEQWGLILLDDLIIGEAQLKETRVNVPGADGSLNMSYGLTDGEPVFEDRPITFTLFASGLGWSNGVLTHAKPKNEAEVDEILGELQGRYHGREVDLILPNDSTHYWHGTLSVGAKSKYNSGKIPISIKAFPYKLKNAVTERQLTIPSGGSTTVTLTNEGRRVTPTITVNATTTITKGTSSWSVQSGTHVISGLYLDKGSTTIGISGTSGKTVKFAYQEGRL